MKRAIAVALALCAPWPLAAQNAITQEGTVLQNAPMMFRGNNRARQGATVNGAPRGQTVDTGDSVVGGRCDYSAPTDDPAGYQKLCIDAKTGTITLDGTKSPLPDTITVKIGDKTYHVPGAAVIEGSDAVVPDNIALKAAVGAVGKRVVRLGFYAPGDGGLATYNWSGTDCVSPDNGAQVQPNTTGCWTADLMAGPIMPQLFGAKGDGVANDAPAIQAAVTAANGAKVYLPRGTYRICSAITSTTPVWIAGAGSGSGPSTVLPNTKITLCNAAQNGFTINSNYGSKFEHFWLTSEVQQSPGYSGIYLYGPATGHVGNPRFENLAFGSSSYDGPLTLYDAVKILVGNYPDYNKIFCLGWVNSCINHVTQGGVEGSGGHIHHSYFFGNPLNPTQGPAIYSEVGYTFIHNNEILAGTDSIHFCIKNFSAGEIDIYNNTIENSKRTGIRIESCDGSGASMVKITNNEFSNVDYAGNMVAEIMTVEYPDVFWLTAVSIQGNVLRSKLPTAGKYIWLEAGGNAIISNNIIEELGANNPWAVQVTGAVNNNSYREPLHVLNNSIFGTTNRVLANPVVSPLIVDLYPSTAVAGLGYAQHGSQLMTYDGVNGSFPCTGGGTGALAISVGTGWKCF